MAEQQIEQNEQCLEEDDVDNPNYRTPAQKSIDEIKKLDAEDESLRKYKETLLGKAEDFSKIAARPDDPRKVVVEELIFCSEDRPEIKMNLSGDLKEVEKQTLIVKEGSKYHLKINFFVQRDIVQGLKFKQKIKKLGFATRNETMVGSYRPQLEMHTAKTAIEDVPSGLMARGTFTVENRFIDDDKHCYLEFEFKLNIKKDWEN